MPELTPAAVKLIIKWEVGGGQAYYDKLLVHPTWPGGASGVTIGVGYDLGYNKQAQFEADWGTRLPAADIARLRGCLGTTGAHAKGLVAGVKDISVSWAAAEAVFFARTVPRFYQTALTAFPGLDKLPGDAQGALVSLVFNRGGGMKDSKKHPGDRREMRAIRDLVPKGDLAGIARELRSMKRLWVGKGLDGLIARREDEAKLVENAKADPLTKRDNDAGLPPQPLFTGPDAGELGRFGNLA